MGDALTALVNGFADCTEQVVALRAENKRLQAELTTARHSVEHLRAALQTIISVYESGAGPCLDLRVSDIARSAIARAEQRA